MKLLKPSESQKLSGKTSIDRVAKDDLKPRIETFRCPNFGEEESYHGPLLTAKGVWVAERLLHRSTKQSFLLGQGALR